jgi:hypothetical protein
MRLAPNHFPTQPGTTDDLAQPSDRLEALIGQVAVLSIRQ